MTAPKVQRAERPAHQQERGGATPTSALSLFAPESPIRRVEEVAGHLDANHYLGAAKRGMAWADGFGVMVFANPSSRRLPSQHWRELTRWCLRRMKNGGSQQWSHVARWVRQNLPDVTTFVSYSDPSVGHTGALYRACNWLWAPTWHRLRPPPSGNGDWGTGQESTKDRWVYPLRPDADRAELLAIRDEALTRKYPWLVWDDRRGYDWHRWQREILGHTFGERAPSPEVG